MENIRKYLKDISSFKKGAGWVAQGVLDACKKGAEDGNEYIVYSLHNQYVEATVEYLVSVAKLDVEITGEFGECSILEISWNDEEQ